jgi:hypothetical protein
VSQDLRKTRQQLLRANGLLRLSREARLRSTSFHSEVAQPLTSRYGAFFNCQITKGEFLLLRGSGL